MADDKTTKTPEQPVTDSGPVKETPPAPPKEPEKVSVSPEPEKKTEPEVKNPQVSVYNFAEIMKEKKVEERAAAPSGEKPAPAKTEKPEKQPEAPKKAEEKPKEPEQPKRRGRPPKADKDKAATPKPEAPAQKPENAVKKEPEKKTAPTVQAAPAPKEPEKPKDAPRRGKEQIVYIKLNELHAFKNHPFEVRDDEEMRAMVSSVKDKGVTQPAIVRPREDGGYEIVSGHRRQKASELAGYADMPCILQLRGLPPFLSPKYDLKKHPNYKYTAEFDKKKNAFRLESLFRHRPLRLKPEDEYTVYEVDGSDTDEEADLLNFDDLDSDEFV